jgi:hypothetical protein
MVGQVFVGLAQGCCQIITVRYSELWFDVRGRVVATMLTNICKSQLVVSYMTIESFKSQSSWRCSWLSPITTSADGKLGSEYTSDDAHPGTRFNSDTRS